MQAQAKRKTRHLRRFKVGIVGANDKELNAFSRILTVTQYRTRCYEAVPLDEKKFSSKNTVDIIVICSRNPSIVYRWEIEGSQSNSQKSLPVVIFSQPNSALSGKYTLNSPLNPSKLIKLLDQFTIKELNFLPEFEIGNDSAELQDIAFSGIKMLRANCNGHTGSGPNTANGYQRRVLVVDDSLAVRRQMQLEFELLNDKLDLAENAEQALQAIQSNKYDVVFLDVVMPGMDGYAACKKIKKDPLNHNTPVILLTSKSSSFDKIKGTLAGCDAYLVKPINHNEFTQAYQQNVLNNGQGAKHASQ
jgi:twitching motility two-component system response regulator PilG